MRAIGSSATYHAAPIHVRRRVTRVHSANVRAKRYCITVWIHFLIVKVIGPLHVSAELRIIFVRRQHKRCAAAPAAHELCCDELLLLRRLSMLSKKIAERAHMLLQAPIGHVAAIPR